MNLRFYVVRSAYFNQSVLFSGLLFYQKKEEKEKKYLLYFHEIQKKNNGSLGKYTILFIYVA